LATTSSPQQTPPLVFQAGPPGVGKSTIGSQVSQAMGLRFLDLSPHGSSDTDQATPETRERLLAAVRDRSVDLIALSWGLQQEKAVLALARHAGYLLLLWVLPPV
jgi:ATP-dependent Lon protease